MYTTPLELLEGLDSFNVSYPTPDIFLDTVTGDVVIGFSTGPKALSIILRPAAQYNTLVSKIYGDPPVTEEVGSASEEVLTEAFTWLYT